METKRIQWENSPEGAWINEKDFNPSIHKLWTEPIPEIIEVVEIAGLKEPIAADPPKKTTKKKAIAADDLAST